MDNVVINKPTDSSSYVAPFSASRAVDSSTNPLSRWLSNTCPCHMRIDLINEYWVSRWKVVHMGAIYGSSDYNMSSYKLQGSMDNITWYDLDVVSGNTLSITDRTFNSSKVRFLRVYVAQGLNANPQVASIAELQVFGSLPTSAKLSNLVLSAGALSPSFSSDVMSYTSEVGYDVESITVIPTAEDSNATIKVNGTIVASGQTSSAIALDVGSDIINIEVTPQFGDPQTYTVEVTRASSSYLSNLTINLRGGITPAFNKEILNYTATAGRLTTAAVTPTAEDSNATIKVNGETVASGSQSQSITLNSGENTITIEVTSSVGTYLKTYFITVNK